MKDNSTPTRKAAAMALMCGFGAGMAGCGQGAEVRSTVSPLASGMETHTFTAAKDATISGEHPSKEHQNYGAASQLTVFTESNGNKRHALIGFNLASVPAGAHIESAVLVLQGARTGPGGNPVGISVRRMLTDHWVEGDQVFGESTAGASWRGLRHADDGRVLEAWGAPGLLEGVDVAPATVAPVVAMDEFVAGVSVTADVVNWAQERDGDVLSFALRNESSTISHVTFDAREQGTGAQLILRYDATDQTAEVSVARDTYISDENPSREVQNFGGAHELFAMTESNGHHREALVAFDLASQVTPGVRIHSARLVMGPLVQGPGGVSSVHVTPLARTDWIEGDNTYGVSTGGATWRAAATDESGNALIPWGAPGASRGFVDRRDCARIEVTDPSEFETGIDVTAHVQRWSDAATDDEIGWALSNPSLTTSHGHFHSREHPEHSGPRLVVTFSELPADPVAAVPPLCMTPLAEQAAQARDRTVAVSPTADGESFNVVTQFYNHGQVEAPEWKVLRMDGSAESSFSFDGGYANAAISFTAASPTGAPTGSQVRADNGRIYFPLADRGLAYYEPTDETVRQVACEGTAPSEAQCRWGDPDAYEWFFRLWASRDGYIYGATQAKSGHHCGGVVRIDPRTNDCEVFEFPVPDYGADLVYGYYAAEDYLGDDRTPWLGVATGQVGQGFVWEFWAVNLLTGEVRNLTEGTRYRHISVEPPHSPYPHAHRVKLDGNIRYFTANASGVPVLSDSAPTTTVEARLDSRRIDIERWPEHEPDWPQVRGVTQVDADGGFTIEWTSPSGPAQLRGHTTVAAPVPFTRARVLLDGSVQAHAGPNESFLRYHPGNGRVSVENRAGLTSSQAASGNAGSEFVVGYASSAVYEWQPTEGHAFSTEDAVFHGHFSQVRDADGVALATAYPSAVAHASNGRLYHAGIPRTGWTSHLSYFDRESGHFGPGIAWSGAKPRGLATVGTGVAITVFVSERVDPASDGDAQLRVFDADLNQLTAHTVDNGRGGHLVNTGRLFQGPGDLFVGYSIDDALLYAFSASNAASSAAGPLVPLAAVALPGADISRREDGTLWAAAGNKLQRVHLSETQQGWAMSLQTVGELREPLTGTTWSGSNLYGVSGTHLYEVRDARLQDGQ